MRAIPSRWSDIWNWFEEFHRQNMGHKGTNQCRSIPRQWLNLKFYLLQLINFRPSGFRLRNFFLGEWLLLSHWFGGWRSQNLGSQKIEEFEDACSPQHKGRGIF